MSETRSSAKRALQDYEKRSGALPSTQGSFTFLHHRRWGLDVALKGPADDAAENKTARSSWRKECAVWLRLGLHPHIQQCYLIELIEGVPHVFCEWQEGTEDLHAYVARGALKTETGERDLRAVLVIALQVAAALDHMHAKDCLYLGLQPSGVLVTPKDGVKLTDFALSMRKYTEEDRVLGLPLSFCAPEQAFGSQEDVDERADIYSWAALVLYLLAGDVLWKDGPSARLYLPALSAGLPPRVRALLEECLSEKPEDRPETMYDVLCTLEHALREMREDGGKESDLGYYTQFSSREDAVETLDVLNDRALSYLALGYLKDAETCWAKALKKDPYHLCAWYNFYQLFIPYYDGYSREVTYQEDRSGTLVKKRAFYDVEKVLPHAPDASVYDSAAQLRWLYRRGDPQSLQQAGRLELLAAARQISMGDPEEAEEHLRRAKQQLPEEPGIRLLEQELRRAAEVPGERAPEDALWAVSPFRTVEQIMEDRVAYQTAWARVSAAIDRGETPKDPDELLRQLRTVREKRQDLWEYLRLNTALRTILPIRGIDRLFYLRTEPGFPEQKCKLTRLRVEKKTGDLSESIATADRQATAYLLSRTEWGEEEHTDYFLSMTFRDAPLRPLPVWGIPTLRQDGRPKWKKAGFTVDNAYWIATRRDTQDRYHELYIPEWLYEAPKK